MSKLTRAAVTNARRSNVEAGGRFFPPRSTTTLDLDADGLARIRAVRGLDVRIVKPAAGEEPTDEKGD